MKKILLLVVLVLISVSAFAVDPAPVAEQPVWMLYFTVFTTISLGISEGLSLIPIINANGIFQAIWNILKGIAGK